ncbi:MAG: Maf family protein [Pseudomonadota bacterium]
MTDHNGIHLILASTSPRREELLRSINICFSIVPPDVEEDQLPQESPSDQVCRLALAKASEVAGRFPFKWVLGADTIVVFDGCVLGKPKDVDEAAAMLGTLAGRSHEVYTGYAIVKGAEPHLDRVRWVRSEVTIRPLDGSEVMAYVGSGEPMDKAGAYAIQGIGSGIVRSVCGSYTNVVGLPICEVAGDLKELGIFDFLEKGKRT